MRVSPAAAQCQGPTSSNRTGLRFDVVGDTVDAFTLKNFALDVGGTVAGKFIDDDECQPAAIPKGLGWNVPDLGIAQLTRSWAVQKFAPGSFGPWPGFIGADLNAPEKCS